MENAVKCPFSNTVWFSQGALLFAYQWLSLGRGEFCAPGFFLDSFTGREAYFNLQEPERNMKEWKELYKGGIHRLQVSQKDLAIALAR